MKPSAYPTSVDLKSLQSDGEPYQFSKKTGELNKYLQDLISDQDYQVDLRLTPAGNVYTISGTIDTKLNLICSRCGREMELPIHDQFSELIIVNDERPRAGHSGHTGLNTESDIFCNYQNSYQFDLAEFIHEHIAAAEPFTPHCGRMDCEDYLQNVQKAKSHDGDTKPNPFEILKNLRTPSQRD